MQEQWEILPDFPIYAISSYGRIRNERRNRLVKITYTRDGEAKVGLVDTSGIQRTRSVRLLVAKTFVPGMTDVFNTPINLDGDRANNNADNLLWRPRWFAQKYVLQLTTLEHYTKNSVPIVDRTTGVIYSNIAEASMINGLLFTEVAMSLVNKIPVFPSWHLFDIVKE